MPTDAAYATPSPSSSPPTTQPWHAGKLAGLLLARIDARILTHRNVTAARAALTRILGRPRLRALRDLWLEPDGHSAPAVVDTTTLALNDPAAAITAIAGAACTALAGHPSPRSPR